MKRKGFLLALVLATLGVVVTLWPALSFANLKASVADLKAAQEQYPVLALALFVVVYALIVGCSFPITPWLSMLGGALFGSLGGTLASVTGATIGSVLAMASSRYLFRDALRRRFGHRLDRIDGQLATSGAYYLFVLRLVPVVPFWLLNLKMGLTSIRLRVYIFATWFGLLPTTFLFAHAGRKLQEIESPRDVWTSELVFLFLGVGLTLLLLKLAADRLRTTQLVGGSE